MSTREVGESMSVKIRDEQTADVLRVILGALSPTHQMLNEHSVAIKAALDERRIERDKDPYERMEHLLMRVEALKDALHRWLDACGGTNAMSDETRELLGMPSWREAAQKRARHHKEGCQRFSTGVCTCGAHPGCDCPRYEKQHRDGCPANGLALLLEQRARELETQREAQREPKPVMTSKDVSRIFKPLPPDEASALREYGADDSADEGDEMKCEDCPPVGYPTDKTRCSGCPRGRDLEAALTTIRNRLRSDPADFESAVAVVQFSYHVANNVLAPAETGSAANATTQGGPPSKPVKGYEPGASDGDLACPAALPSSITKTNASKARL